MQFEEFDNKVRQAADHHHPSYDEQAWTKMEKLLDKHLPQEKEKKRRFIFFLLFFLLLGGGVWLITSRPWKRNEGTIADTGKTSIEQVKQKNSSDVKKNEPGENTGNSIVARTNHSTFTQNKEKDIVRTGKVENNISLPRNVNKRSVPGSNNERSIDNANSPLFINNDKLTGKVLITEVAGNRKAETTQNKNDQIITPVQESIKNDKKVETKVLPEGNTEENVNDKKETVVVQSKEKEPVGNQQKQATTKSKNKKPNSFFLSISAGPDLSFVSSGKTGTTKLIAGGGIGFTLHDRFTIRTGFYSGRKVYTALPGSYNPPASWWAYYPNLEKVDADCKVYEIPVLLSYNFGIKQKSNWFATAGISSLLMKNETYNYFYKYTTTSPTISRKWTITDQNKHYFSILTLSGGYQRKIGNHISLTAEPYIKLPLTGIGFGKVKLNSGGIIFTVGINPFSNRKTETKNLH